MQSMSGSASEEDSSMNRRPSELNAATDLVGLSVPPPPVSAMSKKMDEPNLDKKPSTDGAADDDIAKKPKGSGSGSDSSPAKKVKDEDPVPKSEPKTEAMASVMAASEPQDAVTAPVSVPTPPPVVAGVLPSSNTNKPRGGSVSADDNHGTPADDNHGTPLADVEGPDGEKTAFPILLHEIVNDPLTDDCIHWLSCGTRFMISDKKRFAKDVLPRFYGHAKFTSFTRRLKRWSFTRVPSGPFMGAYYNPNFRRGEPDLATRVRYDHPTPLSGSAMQLNKAKLQAIGMGTGVGAVMGGVPVAGFLNPLMGQMGGQVPMSNEDREVLLRQMNLMNGGVAGNPMGMGMQGFQGQQGMAGGNPNLESLYRAMSQNNDMGGQPGNNLAATNNSVALQMAMAQEMMQLRQQAAMGNLTPFDQARLMAQQQQLNNPNMNLLNQAAQQGAGSQGQGTPEDQRLLAAMFLERLNKQQQLTNNPGQTGLGGAGGNFAGGSMPSLASLTASSSLTSSHPSGLSNMNFGNQGGGSGQNLFVQGSQNGSGGSLNNNPLLNQAQNSNVSLTTLTGGQAQSGQNNVNNQNAAPQLNFNSPSGLGMGAAGALGGAMGQAAGMPNNNPAAMNALLADYLRRTSGNAGGGAGTPGYNNQQGDQKNEEGGKTEASC